MRYFRLVSLNFKHKILNGNIAFCTINALYTKAYFVSSGKSVAVAISGTSFNATSTSVKEDQNTQLKFCVGKCTRANRYTELAIKLQKVFSQKKTL